MPWTLISTIAPPGINCLLEKGGYPGRYGVENLTIRLVFFLFLLGDALAIGTAVISYKHTGVDHFREGGFITTLSVLQLLVISWLSYKIFQAREVMSRQPLWRGSSAVWAIIAVGFICLAADEFFGIHENIDHLIHYVLNLQETGLTDRIDDIIIGLYGLSGIAILIAYRKELIPYREAFPFFIFGFVFLFIMVALDILTNRDDILLVIFDHDHVDVLQLWLSIAEESLKVFSEVFFIVAFFAILQKAKRNLPLESLY